MSSDRFEARVARIDGTEITFEVLTDTCGVDDCCASRAFALLLLSDALRRAADLVPGEWGDPRRDAEVERLYAKAARNSLHDALPDDTTDWYSETWMREHVGRFIVSATLVERRNQLDEPTLLAREQEIADKYGGALYTNQHHLWQPERWARCHNYTLRVVVTEPRWAAHLEPGLTFGTTAFDVWDEH